MLSSCVKLTVVQALSPRDESCRDGHRDALEEQEGPKESKMGTVIGARTGADGHIERRIEDFASRKAWRL